MKKLRDVASFLNIKNPFNRYYFVGKISRKSYNSCFIIKQRVTGTVWIAKISRSLTSHGVVFSDLNQRAILAYRLSKLTNTPIPKSRTIMLNQVYYSSTFMDFIKQIPNEVVKDNIMITKFQGVPLQDFLKVQTIKDLKNLHQILENFVFNLWIGNYDKKNDDYVVDQNNKAWSIDYNLLGPGFKNNDRLALGAWAQPYDFEDVGDAGWCIGELLISELKTENYTKEDFTKVISKIESISESQIKNALKDLNFYKEGTSQNINGVFLSFLTSRKKQIRDKVYRWCEAEFPRGSRPKHN